MSYQDAYDAGYSGPVPSVERRINNRIRKNAARDPRDPDFECEETGDIEYTIKYTPSGIPYKAEL